MPERSEAGCSKPLQLRHRNHPCPTFGRAAPNLGGQALLPLCCKERCEKVYYVHRYGTLLTGLAISLAGSATHHGLLSGLRKQVAGTAATATTRSAIFHSTRSTWNIRRRSGIVEKSLASFAPGMPHPALPSGSGNVHAFRRTIETTSVPQLSKAQPRRYALHRLNRPNTPTPSATCYPSKSMRQRFSRRRLH